ncbi:MAG: hypothetical protein IIA98_01120 [Proteobacteria bacterium]|nr:hypothetical protein [Pseudomonadota bacterium]
MKSRPDRQAALVAADIATSAVWACVSGGETGGQKEPAFAAGPNFLVFFLIRPIFTLAERKTFVDNSCRNRAVKKNQPENKALA